MINKNTGLLDISRALSTISSKVEKQGPLDAEIVPGVDPAWYIAITMPRQESIAAGHLIGHRFGVYQPGFVETTMRHGRKAERWKNLFPGYLFLFVWGIDQHYARIIGTPGIQRMLIRPDTSMPVAVPQEVIDRVRSKENEHYPVTYMDQVVKVSKRTRRKKQKIEMEDRLVQAGPDDVVATYSKSYWARLDEPERFDLLHKALGLPA